MTLSRAEREAREILMRATVHPDVTLGPVPCAGCMMPVVWAGYGWVDDGTVERYPDDPEIWWLHDTICPSSAKTLAALEVYAAGEPGAVASIAWPAVVGPLPASARATPIRIEPRPISRRAAMIGLAICATIWVVAIVAAAR